MPELQYSKCIASNCYRIVLKKYCDQTCQQYAQYEHRIKQWLSGEISGGNSHGVFVWVRRWLLETRGNRCERCGWREINPITGRVPVEIHHKNGNNVDHRPENLEIICPNCHSLTPHFRALNKGNGRDYRRLVSIVGDAQDL